MSDEFTKEEMDEEVTGGVTEEIEETSEDFLEEAENSAEEDEEGVSLEDTEDDFFPTDDEEEEIIHASRKTTVVLISIIVVLVAVVAVFAVILVKKLNQNKENTDVTPTGAVITGDSLTGTGDSGTGTAGDSGTGTGTGTAASIADKEYNVTVTLGQYKGLEVTMEPVEVTDEDIDDEIDYLLEDLAEEIEITDRAVVDGDCVNIDYAGFKGEEQFDGGTAEGAFLDIGSGQFIDGFESGLIGVMPGETVDLNLTFPENYSNEELAGQAVVFKVTVNYIDGGSDIPELTDELVAENTDYSTIEEYREYLRESLEAEALEEATENAENELLGMILDNTTFGGDIDEEIADYAQSYRDYTDSMYMSYYGMDGATVFGMMYGLTEEEYNDMLLKDAEDSVRYNYLLKEVAKAENLSITEEEYDAMVQEVFIDYYGYSSAQEVYDEIGEDKAREMINDTVVSEKAEQFLIDNSTIKPAE